LRNGDSRSSSRAPNHVARPRIFGTAFEASALQRGVVMKHIRVALVGVSLGLWASQGLAAEVPQKDTSDARVEQKIEARFEQDSKLAGRKVDAQASGGTVTLVGMVASEQDRARAERLARIKGVTTVDNQIVVETAATAGKATPASKETARQYERRALSDPERKNAQVGTEPFRTKGSREDFMQSTGLEDPKHPKTEQTTPEPAPAAK
jgi:hypothetical protein